MNWICDTNIISEVFKKRPDQQVTEWLETLEEIYLSVITVEEIICGLAHKNAHRKMAWFDRFVHLRCNVLAITAETARRCGLMRGAFLQKGITRSQADLPIAATASEHHLALATRNEKDFSECGIPVMNPFH